MTTTLRGLAGRVLASAAFLGALSASTASAGQVVVMDDTWVHAPELSDSHYRVEPMLGTPEDWVSPVDYSQGKVYVYLEVYSKPTAQPTKFQVCFEATPTYACTDQSPTYTEVGVYEWATDFADFWSPPGESVDWTLGVNKIACILKDTMNGKPSADNVGPETAALYMPTEVRMVITLVEPGGVYVPPMPSGEGSTGGDETSTSTSTGTSSGADTTTGSSTTGEPPEATTAGEPTTTADPGTSSTGAAVTGEPAMTTSGGSTSGSSGASEGGASEGSGDGCACSSSSGQAPAGLALAGLLLGLGRRRRG